MADTKLTHQYILNEIRAKIFMAPPGKDFLLHETELSKEFGISRTPIRKILQTLAHEKLVVTRSGVGTVAPQLDPATRQRDFEVYGLLGQAASKVSGLAIRSETKLTILGLYQLLQSEPKPDLKMFIDLVGQSNEATCDIVSDRILADALAAARWRVVRWRAQEFHKDPDVFWSLLVKNFESTAEAIKKGDASYYLEQISGVVLKMAGRTEG